MDEKEYVETKMQLYFETQYENLTKIYYFHHILLNSVLFYRIFNVA